MLPRLGLRMFATLVAAGLAAAGLAGCAGSSLPRSVALEEGQPTVLTMQTSGPELSLQNASYVRPVEVYREGRDPGRKVVADAELQNLLDVYTAEDLFRHSLPVRPGDARATLTLEHGGRRWVWAQRGSFTGEGAAAFRKVSSYFLTLYNGRTAYHSAPDALQGSYPKFLSPEEIARRERELRAYDEQKRREQSQGGGKQGGGQR